MGNCQKTYIETGLLDNLDINIDNEKKKLIKIIRKV